MSALFWPHCGYEALHYAESSELLVSDDFLRLLLLSPELAPIPESCASELALHAALLEEPMREVTEAELLRFQDADAIENYRIWLRFRSRLTARPSLEGCYLALFEGQGVDVPPKFVHQLTQVLLRHVLRPEAGAKQEEPDLAIQVRAAEMLFRAQKISIAADGAAKGAVMAADEETVERYATSGGFGSLGELLKKGDMPTRSIDLDVLGADNVATFWEREKTAAEQTVAGQERYEWVLNLNHGSEGLQALCRVMEKWVHHFLGVRVSIQVEKKIDDPQWLWHVGLDAQASSILNDLYRGNVVEEERLKRLLCLFSLRFEDPNDMATEVRGHPVYLAMAMDEHQRLRLKPQNLLLNLPLTKRS